MIDAVLDLARARLAGGIPLHRKSVDLGAVVQRAVQEHAAAYTGRRIDVVLEGDLLGEWDEDRLSQVVSNLLGNAVQHGESSEPVQLRASGITPHAVVLTVANAGHIAPEVLAHLFDPFRGGERSPGHHDGLGLGLYIVQQIVHAHHGSVEARCEEGKRIVFRVELPRGPRDAIEL
jgi:two-component system, sensor histidine kinase and response regulator